MPGELRAEEYLRMPGLPTRAELIGGRIIRPAPQSMWHVGMTDLLMWELRRQAPDGLRTARNMAVKLTSQDVPTPDVLVLTAEAHRRREPDNHFFADDIALVVEVVSPESEERDREAKPCLYAAAGIPRFWRAEEGEETDTVFTHELDASTRRYELCGVHRGRLKVTVPYGIEIDLNAVDRY
ncbi:Uma2 family endonuclease [Actinomadura adrarensis]|uniref:Uma2 family endonuclease n=1 Tax=Actinomadura adrarensis TaxID=1819600 RepID=A0ABW3CR16_9ACTN